MDNSVQKVIIGNIPGAVGLKQHSDNGIKVTKLCTDELRLCIDRSVEVAEQCTRELRQHSDDSVEATDQCDTAEDQLEKSDSGVTAEMEIMQGIDKLFIQNYEQKQVNPSRVIGGASSTCRTCEP